MERERNKAASVISGIITAILFTAAIVMLPVVSIYAMNMDIKTRTIKTASHIEKNSNTKVTDSYITITGKDMDVKVSVDGYEADGFVYYD